MEIEHCIRQQADLTQINRCIVRIDTLNGSFEHVSRVLELAGNPVRLKILFLLYEEKRLCVCDLSDVLGMTIPAVSQHLKRLKDRNMVASEKQAQTVFYSLTNIYLPILRPLFRTLVTGVGVTQ
jgi:DNA-binding transcriptional ArsR family regulator